MFFQRRRLQVLLSLLVIVISTLYLGFQAVREVEPGGEPAGQDSQLSEAYFLLRNNYVRQLDEALLLEGAVAGLRAEIEKRGVSAEGLPDWTPLPSVPGDAGLRRVESYLERVARLNPKLFPRQDVVYTALAGMTETLSDPYTVAMNPETFARFNGGLHSHVVGGIGLEVEWTHGTYVVFEVMPGAPAAQAGIKPGDVLVEVDKVPLVSKEETLSLEQVRILLSGQVGSKVLLTLQRGGTRYTRTLSRATFKTRSVTGRLIGEKASGLPVLGWLKVESLGETTGHEMAETVAALTAKGATGFVIDLRDNVGGYLNAAVEVASLFLPSGRPVVTIEGRAGHKAKHTIGAKPVQAPMVVLVNSRTASSAEILAGALQDHKRAILLGARTFGKGSVQTLHDFADGGGFKMTTAAYLTPDKRVLEGRGLAPDLEVDVAQNRDEEDLHTEVQVICHELWTTKAQP